MLTALPTRSPIAADTRLGVGLTSRHPLCGLAAPLSASGGAGPCGPIFVSCIRAVLLV